jgi:hypothetical protein
MGNSVIARSQGEPAFGEPFARAYPQRSEGRHPGNLVIARRQGEPIFGEPFADVAILSFRTSPQGEEESVMVRFEKPLHLSIPLKKRRKTIWQSCHCEEPRRASLWRAIWRRSNLAPVGRGAIRYAPVTETPTSEPNSTFFEDF